MGGRDGKVGPAGKRKVGEKKAPSKLTELEREKKQRAFSSPPENVATLRAVLLQTPGITPSHHVSSKKMFLSPLLPSSQASPGARAPRHVRFKRRHRFQMASTSRVTPPDFKVNPLVIKHQGDKALNNLTFFNTAVFLSLNLVLVCVGVPDSLARAPRLHDESGVVHHAAKLCIEP